MPTDDILTGLPGEDILRRGLEDFRSQRCTVEACLVHIARPRLAHADLLPSTPTSIDEPEIQLYRLLRQEGGDAYARYNALLRELVSFETALDQRMRTSKAQRN
jgi:hypothetical protein